MYVRSHVDGLNAEKHEAVLTGESRVGDARHLPPRR